MWYNIDTVWCKILRDARSQDEEWLNVSISMLTRSSLWEQVLMLPTPHRTVTRPECLWHHLARHFYVNITQCVHCWAIFQATLTSLALCIITQITITGSIWLLRLLAAVCVKPITAPSLSFSLTPISLYKHIKLFGSVLICHRKYFPKYLMEVT